MKKPIRILGIPLDLGQTHRGVDMGPGAVRYAGLAARLRKLGQRVSDAGNVEVPIRDTLPEHGPAHLLEAICRAGASIYQVARRTVAQGNIPIFLGGDHSIAIGTVGGVSHEEPCGLVWIDAHADFNTLESSETGNVHGMALAALAGRGASCLVDIGRPGKKIRPEHIALVGVRDLDPQERDNLKQSGIRVYTMRDIDERGVAEIMNEVLTRFTALGRIHVSFDLDAIDPAAAPGVGTPATGGLTPREAHLIMENIADSGKLCSLDLVEINPILDFRNQTGELAVQLAASLFGKSIL